MEYQDSRKEQLDTLINQYQDLLFIEEQRLLNTSDERYKKSIEDKIKAYKAKLDAYLSEMQYVEGLGNKLVAHYYEHNDKKLILNEFFTNNDNYWWIGNTEKEVAFIQAEVYVIEAKLKEKSYFRTIPINIDFNKDFEIEARISFVKGYDNNGFGICWGNKSNNDFCCFEIAMTGFHMVRKLDKGKTWRKLTEWQKTDYIHSEGIPNIFRVKREGKEIFLTLNKKDLPSIKTEKFDGQDIGFIIQKPMKIVVDYIKVWGME